MEVKKEIKKDFNKYKSIVFVFANKEGFFANLNVLPGSTELLIKAANLTGENANILTAPIKSNKYCEKEKRECQKDHFSADILPNR